MKKSEEKPEIIPELTTTNRVPKHQNHDHYWIDGGVMYETYTTIRGKRYRVIKAVPGANTEHRVGPKYLQYISDLYFK